GDLDPAADPRARRPARDLARARLLSRAGADRAPPRRRAARHELPGAALPGRRLAATAHAAVDALAGLLAGAAVRGDRAAVRRLDRRDARVPRLGRRARLPELPR